ncbi:MAG: hypothetical protein Q9174_002928 [Haloplaca sp. 1 TL-2023]
MWLLNTSTLALHHVLNPDEVKYAILSHTWGDEEVSFQDMTIESDVQAQSLTNYIYGLGEYIFWNNAKSRMKQRKGYKKVARCCAQALADGYEWAWVDTVCIDKKSSAELSEAINSMYEWYSKAAKCYTYMSDVSITAEDLDASTVQEFKSSRWFRRGWTLQELLAPSVVIFYNKNWRCLGNKKKLAEYITSASGISQGYLLNNHWCVNASIATRLFQINMSLLYGEGSRAFIRLQHEIVRKSDDESIFAWYAEEMYSGLFAKRPSAFARCDGYFQYFEPEFTRAPYAMTNRGLCLDAVYRTTLAKSRERIGRPTNECILLPLNCTRKYTSGKPGKPFTIILRNISPDVYVRYLPCEIVDFDVYGQKLSSDLKRDTMYVRTDPLPDRWELGDEFVGKYYKLLVALDGGSVEYLDIKDLYVTPPGKIVCPNQMGDRDWRLRLSGWSGFAVMFLQDTDGNPFRISITYDHTSAYETAFHLHTPEHDKMNAIVKENLAQHEERKMSLSIYEEYTHPVGGGKIVVFKRQPMDGETQCFTLGIISV